METEPAEPSDSTPPESKTEEPVPAVPTRETTPVWASTVPVAPAEGSAETDDSSDADEALPALPMEKGDPDWSKTESSSANGESKKSAPGWAQTVPTSPGEPLDVTPAPADAEATAPPEAEETAEPVAAEATAEPLAAEATLEPSAAEPEPVAEPTTPPLEEEPAVAPLTDPPKAVAADAVKSTWPPAAETAPAPPEETDIWPPEPPTERAMPAWPPPSELEEPATPAQAIPTWPDSFDAPAASAAAAAASVPPTITPEARPAPAPSKPAAPPPPPPPPAMQKAADSPPVPAPAPAPPPPAPAAPPPPVSPAQAGPPARPTWAPTPQVEPTAPPPPPKPTPVNIPAWAPRVPLASEPGTPTWFSPKEAIPHPTGQPVVPAPEPPPPAPAPPVSGGKLPVAQIPPTPPPAQAQSQPPAGKPAWSVVEQQAKVDPKSKGPTAEDRSYAEWFAWAKRGGAPASACHAAAQGAFKALSSGKDVATAVQWATAAMSRPPQSVSQARQSYCAWFALGNIDLNLDQHRAHLFAAGALQALDAGQDASTAHAAGLAAAGIH